MDAFDWSGLWLALIAMAEGMPAFHMRSTLIGLMSPDLASGGLWSPRASCALPVLNSPHLSTLHPSDPLTARWRRDTSGHHVFAGVCRICDAVRWFPLRPPCALCLPSAISLIVRRLLERKTSFPVLFRAVVCVMWIFYHLIFFCYSWKMKVWLSWVRICLFIWLLLQFMLESSRWTGSLNPSVANWVIHWYLSLRKAIFDHDNIRNAEFYFGFSPYANVFYTSGLYKQCLWLYDVDINEIRSVWKLDANYKNEHKYGNVCLFESLLLYWLH